MVICNSVPKLIMLIIIIVVKVGLVLDWQIIYCIKTL